MHVAHRPLRRDDPLALPSGTGISSAITASSVSVVDSTLAYDHISTTTGLDTPVTTTLAFIDSPSSTSTSSADSSIDSGAPTTVAASSTKPIALSTVIATCVGAFIVVTSIIIFSFWVYRRYSRSLDNSNKRGHLHRRNLQASEQQRRSNVGIWNKLEDQKDDEWEKSYHTREAKDSVSADVTPMEKLTMFKKSPSVRTAYTHKSTDASNFSFPSSYAEFDPSLAASLKASTSGPQPLLKHTDTGLISWAESNATHPSSAVSVPCGMAIPTPSPTPSHPHRWEAAEVVHYSEGQSAEVINPFEEDEDEGGKTTIHNPFFSAKDYAPSRTRRSNSLSTSRSRASSTATQATVTQSKGKERARNISNATITAIPVNPFDDISRPSLFTHAPSSSTTSMETGDKERALRSLVAALNITEDEVRDRLRIASMQTSIVSTRSSVAGSDDMTNEFPLPPSTPSTAFSTLNRGSMTAR